MTKRTGGGWKLTGATSQLEAIPNATDEQRRAAVCRVVRMAGSPHDAAMLLDVLGLVETAREMRAESGPASGAA